MRGGNCYCELYSELNSCQFALLPLVGRKLDVSEICLHISDMIPAHAASLSAQILRRVTDDQKRRIWTPADFLDLGSRDAVDKALQRLAHSRRIRRIERGLYDRPSLNPLTRKTTIPDYRQVIEAIARRDQSRMLVDGLTAANELGLTNAVPGRIVVHSEIRRRSIKLGNQVIEFKQTAPSRLYWAGRPAMRVVQALHWLKDILPQQKGQVVRKLAGVFAAPEGMAIRDDLQKGFSALPTWMQPIVRELIAVPDHHELDDDDDDHDHETGTARLVPSKVHAQAGAPRKRGRR